MKDLRGDEPNAARPATVLLSFCILVLASIWLLNVSIHKGRKGYYAGLQRLEARTEMVNRLERYRAKGSYFYEKIILAALRADVDHRDPINLVRFFHNISAFAERANAIISENPQVEWRREQMLSALRANFPFATDYKNHQLAERLSAIDSPDEWPSIAYWIVFERWPEPDQDGQARKDSISYTNRYTRVWGFTEEDKLLSRRLVWEGEKNAEALLAREYLETANRLATASRNSSEIGLSGLGVSIPVSDLLFFVGPTLVALTAVFLIVRERGLGTSSNSNFSFPQYRSPNDPLLAMGRCNVVDCAQRALWSAFLILPLLILTIGSVFRYDIATPLAKGRGFSALVPTAMELRISDSVDNVLDTVNLMCVAIVLIFVYTLTSRTDRAVDLVRYRKWSRAAWTGSTSVAVLCAGLIIYVVCFRDRLFYSAFGASRFGGYPLYCMAGFALVLLTGGYAGVRRRLRFFTVVCIALLVALAISLSVRPDWNRLYWDPLKRKHPVGP